MEKPPLLFLCHRIPYPPNKGDKIRSFHLLHHLSQHFDIFLGSFVDDPDDWPWKLEVEKFCRETFLQSLVQWKATLRSLRGLITGEALSIPYYASREMASWVERTVRRHGIRHAIVYSSAMAQFLPGNGEFIRRKVIDFVDVDSDKWEQYSRQKHFPLNWVYRREARKLLSYEKQLAVAFDAGLFVSSAEASLFHQLSPETSDKVGYYNNGVNCEYFDPCVPEVGSCYNPYRPGSMPLVFTGAMDYWPNIDAVEWFSREILPNLQTRHAGVELHIVGGSPAARVRKLNRLQGVEVTGRVVDIRPYIRHAVAVVAPLRIARGVQNKVLEGMAMARPVMVSRAGLEGIEAVDREEVLLAETPQDYLERFRELLDGQYAGLGDKARERVRRDFSWDRNLPEVVMLLSRETPVVPGARRPASE